MWKFLRNLFKKKHEPIEVSFEYGEETVISARKDKDGLWTVDIRTTKELDREILKDIIKELKRRTNNGRIW